MIEKIVSGGQTGVDLAALDAAIRFGIPYGGWCPKGRINEEGMIPKRYECLKEIPGDFRVYQEDEKNRPNYDARTKANIQDSDGTLILLPMICSDIQNGTKVTIEELEKLKNKPFLKIDLSQSSSENVSTTLSWIEENAIKTLNIAGPRETSYRGIYQLSTQFLEELLPCLRQSFTPAPPPSLRSSRKRSMRRG